MDFDYIDHKICGHFLSALINGDYTGLNDAEEKLFFDWMDHVHKLNAHFDVISDEGEFSHCEIVDLMGDVYIVRQFFPVTEGVTK
jgi:hypothetical protein